MPVEALISAHIVKSSPGLFFWLVCAIMYNRMEENFKWVVIGAVVIMIVFRLINNAETDPATTTTKSNNSATISQNATATTKNQIITTQLLDDQGRVVKTRESRY